MRVCKIQNCEQPVKTRRMCNKHYLRYWKATSRDDRPSTLRDLTGREFGRLTVIQRVGLSKDRQQLWECKCTCGRTTIVSGGHLNSGHTASCGCLANDMHIKQLETHGLTTGGKPRLFTIWVDMKARCFNPSSKAYARYGGRGISICSQWMSFENFYHWAMSHGYSDCLQIDRIDNDGSYCPENCHWVTPAVNCRNTSRNHYITFNGVSKTVTDWIREYNIPKTSAYAALRKGQQYFVNKFLGDKGIGKAA